jgi:glycosyltransferase involved in cell wall biosynthesis
MAERLHDLSAFVICKDEATSIGPCIESLENLAEIVIVDSGSTDGTIELIQSYSNRGFPIRLFQRDWPGYAKQKQFALEQCTSPWCLSLDADERLDEVLRSSLPSLMADTEVQGWRFRFRAHLYGYGYTPPSVEFKKSLRLVRNGAARFNVSLLVHEALEVDGAVKDAKDGFVLHARSLSMHDQLVKENHYSSLKAEQMFASGKRAHWSRLVFNPLLYFYRLYFWRRFYRCGWAGFVHAGTGAVYSFLTEAKLFQMEKAAAFKDPSTAD